MSRGGKSGGKEEARATEDTCRWWVRIPERGGREWIQDQESPVEPVSLLEGSLPTWKDNARAQSTFKMEGAKAGRCPGPRKTVFLVR